MQEVGAFEAKNRLSELLRYVEDTGEEVRITNRGKAVARLVPEKTRKKKKKSAGQIFQELMDYADAHHIRSDGVSIKAMIEEGRR